MELFFLVPASVYNKDLITQSVTRPELPKYQPSENHTHQVDSFKKEINKNIFSKADSLVDKNLSSPRIKLSNSQTSILDGVETGIFLLDFAQRMRRKNADIPDIYFTLLDAAGISPTVILNQNAKAKGRGTVRNLVKSSTLSVSKVRQFLHSKSSYTKFTLATRKFERMEGLARFKNEIWCMDLA